MADLTESLIRSLRPEGQAAAIYLINAARQAGVPVVVVETRRTLQRQRALLASGASRTLHSAHLLGRAFDVGFVGHHPDAVPLPVYSWLHDLWLQLGGRPMISWDRVHFEW